MKRPTSIISLPIQICVDCSRPIVRDEVAISRRLIGRGIVRFYCIGCLAKRLGVESTTVYRKIEEYRSIGCALFPVTQEE